MLNSDPRDPIYADEIQCQIEAIAANLKQPNVSLLHSPMRGSSSSLLGGDSNAAKNVKTQVSADFVHVRISVTNVVVGQQSRNLRFFKRNLCCKFSTEFRQKIANFRYVLNILKFIKSR